MIHELLGIKDGTVILSTPKVPDQYRRVVSARAQLAGSRGRAHIREQQAHPWPVAT
jgi:hypothetical protein